MDAVGGETGRRSERYYLGSVASGLEDYYSGYGEPHGRWVGPAATRLGLTGEVGAQQLEQVLAGLDPVSGERGGGAARDATIARMGPDVQRAEVRVPALRPWPTGGVQHAFQAHQAAVAEALEYLDRHAVFSHRGGGRADHTVAGVGLVTAAFHHRTSRAGDPPLHTHVLAANLVEHVDGGFGALHSPMTYRHARTAGYLHQAILRAELSERLGVRWQTIHNGQAEIAGFHDELLAAFSQRAAESRSPPGRAG